MFVNGNTAIDGFFDTSSEGVSCGLIDSGTAWLFDPSEQSSEAEEGLRRLFDRSVAFREIKA